MFGAAKGQMFEQMGKAALRLGFEHRTDIHADADRNLPRRHAIVAHGIAQPVRQLAALPRQVAGHVAAGLEPLVLGGARQNGTASWSENVCQSLLISVVDLSVK